MRTSAVLLAVVGLGMLTVAIFWVSGNRAHTPLAGSSNGGDLFGGSGGQGSSDAESPGSSTAFVDLDATRNAKPRLKSCCESLRMYAKAAPPPHVSVYQQAVDICELDPAGAKRETQPGIRAALRGASLPQACR